MWRFAPGLVPGQPNEGVVSQLEGTPARLADFDDSGWEICPVLTKWHSRGMAFAWYRIRVPSAKLSLAGREEQLSSVQVS